MNNKLILQVSLYLVIISGFSLTGCGDIQQELRLQKDGSGTLETSFDVGELMGMADGFQDMGFDQDTFSDDTMPDPIPVTPDTLKDPMKLLIERVTDPTHAVDFDTMMTLMSIMPDSVKEKETRPDLANKISVRMKSPANSADLTMGIVMNFDSPKQLKEIVNYMSTLNPDALASAGPLTAESESFMAFDVDMKAGWIRFDTVSYSDFAVQMGMSQDSAVSSEEMGMVEMMFGNSKIKSIIYVPGEVTSCTNPDAILTKDNRVLVEFPFMDVMKKGKVDGYTIYFTPQP